MRVCEESETFPRAWRLNRSTISTNLELIWEMSVKRQGSSGDGSKAVTENTTKEEQENIGVCDICGAETKVVEIIYGSSPVKYCRECLLDADLNDAT